MSTFILTCMYLFMCVCTYVTQASGRSSQGDIMSDKEIKRKGFLFAEERYRFPTPFLLSLLPSLPPSLPLTIPPSFRPTFSSFLSFFLHHSLPHTLLPSLPFNFPLLPLLPSLLSSFPQFLFVIPYIIPSLYHSCLLLLAFLCLFISCLFLL